MAVGQPYLVVWSKVDNTVRLFELSGSAFVQIGTSALTVGSDVVSNGRLFFSADGNHILGVGKASLAATTALLYNWDLTLTLIQAAVARPTMAAVNHFAADLTKTNNILSVDPASANYATALLVSGQLDTVATSAFGDSSYVKWSPDETGLFQIAASVSQIVRVSGRSGIYANAFVVTNLPNAGPGVVADWSSDSKYLFIGCSNGTVECWAWDGSAATLTQQMASPGYGAVTAVSVRPGGRYVAIGYFDGTTYRTVIYRRIGPYLKQLQVISGLGRLLNWTQDGQYLLDAGSKVGYQYVGNDVFSQVTGMLDAVPANVVSQAVSPHAVSVTGSPQLYDLAVPAIVNKTYDPTGIKFALLDATATFSHNATSAMAIKGGKEVSGNNWPEGGKPVANLHVATNSIGAVASADNTTQAITGTTGLDFRYGLIYDATHDTPLVWVDWGAAQHVDSSMTIVLNFSSPGLIQFAT